MECQDNMADDRFTGIFHVRGNYVSRKDQDPQQNPYQVERDKVSAEFEQIIDPMQTELHRGPVVFKEYPTANAAAGTGYIDAIDLYEEISDPQTYAQNMTGIAWDVETVALPETDASGAVVRKNGKIVWKEQKIVQLAMAEHNIIGTTGALIDSTANKTANVFLGDREAMDHYQKLLGFGPKNTWTALKADKLTMREYHPYLRTLWNAGITNLSAHGTDVARFHFGDITKTADGSWGLSDNAKMVFASAFEMLEGNATLQDPGQIAKELYNHLNGFKSSKYGTFLQIGANLSRFDIPLMNKYLAPINESVSNIFGTRVFDTYAVQRSLTNPNDAFRIYERNTKERVRLPGQKTIKEVKGKRYRLSGLNVDSFRNISTSYGLTSRAHDALFDLADEAQIANAVYEAFSNEMSGIKQPFGKITKNKQIVYAKRGIYSGSSLDGSYSLEDGRWKLNHQGSTPISAGGAYMPVNIKGQAVFEFNQNGTKYYGRMFEDYDTGMRHFVSSTNRDEMDRLLSTSFQTADVGKNNPLFTNRVRRLEDYARRQYEDLFIGNKPNKSWEKFDDTIKVLRNLKDNDKSLWDELSLFNPETHIEDSGYMIARLRGSSAMQGKSLAQIRNMVWMFPRLSKEFEGLESLHRFVEGQSNNLGGDEYVKGQILGFSYDTLRTQQSAARRTQLTVNQFDLAKSVLMLNPHGGAGGTMNLVASTPDGIYAALYSAYKGAEERAVSQRSAVYDVIHNLYARAGSVDKLQPRLKRAENQALRLLNLYMTDDDRLPTTALRSIASSVSNTLGYVHKKSSVLKNEIKEALGSGTYTFGLNNYPVVGYIEPTRAPFDFTGIEDIVKQSASDYESLRGYKARLTGHGKDLKFDFSPSVARHLEKTEAIIDRRISRFKNKAMGNPIKNATRDALESITGDFIRNGYEVQYVLDHRNNKIILVGMSNEIASSMLRQYRNNLGDLPFDQRAVTVDIPLLDEYGNFYYKNGYKTNPLMLNRVRDKRGNLKFTPEAYQGQVQQLLKRVDNGEDISDVFAATFQLTDAYANVLGATKRAAHKALRDSKGLSGDIVTRSANLMQRISSGSYSMISELMTQEWVSNVKDTQSRSLAYRVTNSAELEFDELSVALHGLMKRDELYGDQRRSGANAANKLLNYGKILADGSSFNATGKLEAFGGGRGSLLDRGQYAPFGELASSGREELAQSFNNRMFNRDLVLSVYGNDVRRTVPYMASQKELADIIRPSEGAGVVNTINANIVVANDAMLRDIAKEIGISPDKLPTITENSGLISSAFAKATVTREAYSIKFGLGDTIDQDLVESIKAGTAGPITPGTIVGRGSNGEEIRWNKPRTFFGQGVERQRDGSWRIIGEVEDTAERSSQKLVFDQQKLTTNTNSELEMIFDYFENKTGRRPDLIVGGKTKKNVGYVYLTEVINDMFKEITDNMESKQIALDENVKRTILKSLNTSFTDIFASGKPVTFATDINTLGQGLHVLTTGSIADDLGHIQTGGEVGRYNAFYEKTRKLLNDAGYDGLLNRSGANLPGRVDNEQQWLMGVSAVSKANVDDWVYSVGGVIYPGQKGVGFGIRELEALQSHSIVVGGKMFGHATLAEKYFLGMINPLVAKEFGTGSTRTEEEWNRLVYRAQDKFVTADVLLGRYDETADTVRRYGRKVSLERVNLKDYNQVINADDSEAVLGHTLFDTEGDGRIVQLDKSYSVGGRNINQFFVSGRSGVNAVPRVINDEGKVKPVFDPYRSEVVRIANAQAEANQSLLALEQTPIAERETSVEEILQRRDEQIKSALERMVKVTGRDTAESTGFVAKNILGTQLPYSGNFRLAGRNIFSDSQAVEISEDRLRKMLSGKNLDSDFVEAFMDVAGSDEGFAGAARIGRNPKFFGTSEGFVRLKTSKDLADMQVRVSVGRAGMFQGDFDSDTATLALYNIEGLQNEFRARKAAGEDPKNILLDFSNNLSEWVTKANKDPNIAKDYHAGGVSLTEAMMREAALFTYADENAAGILQDQLRKANQSAFPNNGKMDDIIDAMGRAQIAFASKATKNIGAASNAATRLRRSFGIIQGALDEQFSTQMTDAFGSIGEAGLVRDALEGLMDVVQYGADYNTQGATSGFTKRLSELVQGGTSKDDIVSQINDLVTTLGQTTRALNTADFEKISGTLHDLGIENIADLKDAYSLGLGSKYGGATDNPIAQAMSDVLAGKGADGADRAIVDIFKQRDEARHILSNLMPMFKDNTAFNAFLVKPSVSDRFDESLEMMETLLNPNGVDVMSPFVGQLYKALNMQEGEEAYQQAQTTVRKMMTNAINAEMSGSAGYKTYRRWDTADDEARDAAVRMAGKTTGGGFSVGGLAAGIIGAGAVWALSAATRPAPDVQLGVGDQAPDTSGRYINPAELPPAPGGAGLPTARIMMDNDAMSQIRMSISGNLRGRNKVQAEDLLYSVKAQMDALGISANVTLNNNDKSTRASRREAEEKFKHYAENGYAY